MRISFFILLLFVSLVSFSQYLPADVQTDFASKQNREALRKKMIDTSINLNLKLPLADSTEGEWIDAFWAMELLRVKNDFTERKLTEAWKKAATLSEDFQSNLLEVSFSLYPKVFKEQAYALLQKTSSIPVFVIAAEYVMDGGIGESDKVKIASLIPGKFPDINDNRLTILAMRLEDGNEERNTPPLADLFDKEFLPGKTVIYSLQRKNRNYTGLVIIRKADGSFAKNEDGSLFAVPQLAKAITGFPFYITNGNTPQGIYRWTGSEVSKLKLIGPTPNIQMVLPVEVNPLTYFNDSSLISTVWTKDLYARQLPVSWKNYEGIYEAFYSGSVGRNSIIMHGTTVDPGYYKNETYFPQTPSLGCLCSYEEWDDSGRRTLSYMQEIVDETRKLDASEGYVVVIDLDDENKQVTATDISEAVRSAELRLLTAER